MERALGSCEAGGGSGNGTGNTNSPPVLQKMLGLVGAPPNGLILPPFALPRLPQAASPSADGGLEVILDNNPHELRMSQNYLLHHAYQPSFNSSAPAQAADTLPPGWMMFLPGIEHNTTTTNGVVNQKGWRAGQLEMKTGFSQDLPCHPSSFGVLVATNTETASSSVASWNSQNLSGGERDGLPLWFRQSCFPTVGAPSPTLPIFPSSPSDSHVSPLSCKRRNRLGYYSSLGGESRGEEEEDRQQEEKDRQQEEEDRQQEEEEEEEERRQQRQQDEGREKEQQGGRLKKEEKEEKEQKAQAPGEKEQTSSGNFSKRKKVALERLRRKELAQLFYSLQTAIPSLRSSTTRPTKALLLQSAVVYIHSLETEIMRLREENTRLRL